MVNTTELRNELELYGDVLFCDVNNDISYVVVVNNWSGGLSTYENIQNTYITTTYSKLINLTLREGVLKVEYNK